MVADSGSACCCGGHQPSLPGIAGNQPGIVTIGRGDKFIGCGDGKGREEWERLIYSALSSLSPKKIKLNNFVFVSSPRLELMLQPLKLNINFNTSPRPHELAADTTERTLNHQHQPQCHRHRWIATRVSNQQLFQFSIQV